MVLYHCMYTYSRISTLVVLPSVLVNAYLNTDLVMLSLSLLLFVPSSDPIHGREHCVVAYFPQLAILKIASGDDLQDF